MSDKVFDTIEEAGLQAQQLSNAYCRPAYLVRFCKTRQYGAMVHNPGSIAWRKANCEWLKTYTPQSQQEYAENFKTKRV